MTLLTSWQDYVTTAVSLAFIISLVPSMLDRNTRIPAFTSALTGTGLAILAVVYASLTLDISATTTAVMAACWWVLLIWRRP